MGLPSSASLTDRLGAATLVVTAGTLALAGLAAIVAIAAYAESVHRPMLDVGLSIEGTTTASSISRNVKGGAFEIATSRALMEIKIEVANNGDAVARHLFVRLMLDGYTHDPSTPDDWLHGEDWRAVRSYTDGMLVFIWGGWEGGVVLPGISLVVPRLSLKTAVVGSVPGIFVTTVADGAKPAEIYVGIDPTREAYRISR